jgi:hypothetical protein
MRCFLILAMMISISGVAPVMAAEESGGLSLDDLGFKDDQLKSDPELQATLHKRSKMLKTHQILGLITAVPLVATVMTAPEYGEPNPNGVDSETSTHRALGITTGALYLSTAYFSLTAPEGESAKKNKGMTKVHKALAWIHFPAMIAAPILGYQAYKQADKGEAIHGAAKYHKDVAGVAAGAYLAAMVVMVFNF